MFRLVNPNSVHLYNTPKTKGAMYLSALLAVKVSTDACEKHAFSPSKVSITGPMTIGFGFYDN